MSCVQLPPLGEGRNEKQADQPMMTRPFRPFAKIPVKLSFTHSNRPKKVYWHRGFVKIVDDCIQFSNYIKQQSFFQIERFFKSGKPLHGKDTAPYIFSLRLNAKNPENQGQRRICLNFNGNLEGYQYAINTINKAFETFAHRFLDQKKHIPVFLPRKKKTSKKNKEKKVENTDHPTVVAKPSEQQKEQASASAPKLVAPKRTTQWMETFERLMGGPSPTDTAVRVAVDPKEEERLAEIRRINTKKLEERTREKEEKRKKEKELQKKREEELALKHKRMKEKLAEKARQKRLEKVNVTVQKKISEKSVESDDDQIFISRKRKIVAKPIESDDDDTIYISRKPKIPKPSNQKITKKLDQKSSNIKQKVVKKDGDDKRIDFTKMPLIPTRFDEKVKKNLIEMLANRKKKEKASDDDDLIKRKRIPQETAEDYAKYRKLYPMERVYNLSEMEDIDKTPVCFSVGRSQTISESFGSDQEQGEQAAVPQLDSARIREIFLKHFASRRPSPPRSSSGGSSVVAVGSHGNNSSRNIALGRSSARRPRDGFAGRVHKQSAASCSRARKDSGYTSGTSRQGSTGLPAVQNAGASPDYFGNFETVNFPDQDSCARTEEAEPFGILRESPKQGDFDGAPIQEKLESIPSLMNVKLETEDEYQMRIQEEKSINTFEDGKVGHELLPELTEARVINGQNLVGMNITNSTIIGSRLVKCNIENSTIINCVLENTNLTKCHVTSQ